MGSPLSCPIATTNVSSTTWISTTLPDFNQIDGSEKNILNKDLSRGEMNLGLAPIIAPKLEAR